jgi:glyoxylase-like metal-dependent hydrolase (beta-lactamase superfamily II)
MALHGNGILHLGDALLHTPGKGLELMPDQFISDKKQYRASLQKLLPLEYDVVTFGHGEPLLQAGHATIAKFLKPRR